MTELTREKLIEVYQDCKGNYSKMAKFFGLGNTRLKGLMCKHKLALDYPPMGLVNRDPRRNKNCGKINWKSAYELAKDL